MKREIKFRAKVNGSYVYSKSYVNLAFYFDATHGYKQEQFTGLKDKNKVDIYENDVFCCNKVNYILRFLTLGGAYTVHKIEDETDERFLHHCNHQIQVIGNIYQNPELLKK